MESKAKRVSQLLRDYTPIPATQRSGFHASCFFSRFTSSTQIPRTFITTFTHTVIVHVFEFPVSPVIATDHSTTTSLPTISSGNYDFLRSY